jgi:hypothetical protein
MQPRGYPDCGNQPISVDTRQPRQPSSSSDKPIGVLPIKRAAGVDRYQKWRNAGC